MQTLSYRGNHGQHTKPDAPAEVAAMAGEPLPCTAGTRERATETLGATGGT